MNKIKSVLKPVLEEVKDFAKATKDQITVHSYDKNPSTDASDKTREFVKDLYGLNEKTAATEVQKGSQEAQNKEKKAKLEKLRQQLHAQYYQSLVNRPKPPEEKPAEKVEREKKEERWELEQKEKKKPPPLAVQRAQKVEKYPGVSG